MRELVNDVWLLDGFPKDNRNVYVVGDVLIDAGIALDKGRILKQIDGRPIATHALTHAHFDHFGASHAICEKLGIPLWCGAKDVEAVEKGKMVGPGDRLVPGPHKHPVARALSEGDEVGGFEVLDVPGHSPGHIAFWRESDRTLICGDVMWGYNPFTLAGSIREPFAALSPDPELNRESARKLAALDPALVAFGHGKPRDGEAFKAAVAKLA
jgi:glyoxylase-like metal-dependent hydrolase (beta-lactamase superfamily II)